ncbi:MAG: molybdopterin-dependent oxidoreductase [Gammaproteobacteria bacterium]|nr:molybdopterin-dependent oxidoreductase [Rhodocyclaceae bacterium]MBU3908673.1 molybdopterin-dependent oxidoreductase [Gammaproteobacteria bacterium]MBU4004701.1 molybdopterin-dependent oxidoreductase [Gammaproteobacteria bacterium]MBU4021304.1 molybdopterin-dependent oxidoreductase [Gammaproteobacteria bacterium]MBU4096321.1 molybdopterin-dependent oxidoreductase [Gammaproteobacteria bacterium]
MKQPNDENGRRKFLQMSGAVFASMTVPTGVSAFSKIQPNYDPLKEYPYRGWEDLYRKEWTWDSVGFTTHSNGCVAGCAWKVYVKNGIPMRDEQVSEYPQLPGIPDMNPRGCAKGAVYCSWVKQPDFLKYPLKRVGERGERKWKRISWDEALTEIADKVIDTTLKHGPGNICIPKRPFAVISNNGYTRLANLLGAIKPDVSSMTGDLYPGIQTVRMPARAVSTFDDWFTSDLILMWHKNPIVTRQPDAHFLMEARYNGARLVNISADYNPSSVHADLFVPVKMGTDSYLAAAIVNQLLAGKHYKADYLKEQTDLPFLVRVDNGKFLREKDFKADGSVEIFYVWDTKTGKAVPAPGSMGSKDKTLKLGAVAPALEGSFEAEGIKVTTVFERLKTEMAPYTPEATQSETGIHPSVVRKLTGWIAECKALRILDGYNNQKHMDGFQCGRLKILILTLIGHHGTTGSIDTTYEGWRLEGSTEMQQVKGKNGRSVSMVLAQWVWGEQYRRTKAYYDDAQLKSQLGFGVDDMEALRKESEAKGWMPKWQSIKNPVVYINAGINIFATSNGYQHLAENFLKRCELLVNVDFRMNSGCMYADIVLPAAPEQQKLDIRETSVTRFIHAFGQPIKPMYERKTDWQIVVALGKKIQERAKARGISRVDDPEIKSHIDFDTVYDELTMNGAIDTDEKALRFVMEKSKALGPGSYEEAMKNGFVAVSASAGKTSSIPKDKPYRPFTVNVTDKKPYGTLTGRLQFYVDHEWFQRFGATLPTPQMKGGGHLGPKKYPFKANSPHTRWGIHSWCRNETWLLRHQRGEPDVCLSPKVMASKGIKDGDKVRVFNGQGEFFAMAKVAPSLPDDQVFSEHGWEQYLYKNMTHYNMIGAELINPLELVGGYGHIKYASGGFNPNRIFCETTVDVEKA